MKIIKTKLFIVLLFLATIVLSFLFITKDNRKEKVSKPQENIAPFNSLQIETDFVSKIPIQSLLKKENIIIPNQLSAYRISGEIWPETEILSIASKFGFSSEPIKLKDGRDGDVFVWNSSDGATIRIVPSLHKIDYKSSARSEVIGVSQPFPTDSSLISIAQDFLAPKNLFPLSAIKFSRLIFLNPGDDAYKVVEKETAEFADIQFTETIGSYPILNSRAPGTIDIKINRAGHIVSVFIDTTGILSIEEKYSLKTFAELESSLSQASIQSLDQGAINFLNNPTAKVISIIVENASLAYLQEQDPAQQILQPIFVLTGTATLADMRVVPITLYLPAFRNND